MFAIIICGCSNNSKEKDEPVNKYVGYVVQKEDGRILVTRYDEKSDLNDAIWIRTKRKIELGQQVSIEIDGGIDTSYPAQASARDIDILTNERPKLSKFGQQEVIVMTLEHFDQIEVPFIKSIHYSDVNNVWTVVILDGISDSKKEMEFTIEG
ncbi:DUF3221 domain-containing protein [Paenibacillus sp. JZ16]|uniref:DUF3221 domain-containing protein n=1 Tax=Paenibacillus sp. JZ16 TaxID=1906272 RepID=UPI00188A12ED|nr:DUF3221 domain-containing protein [Paenibacillus sp. JZ16]